MADRKSALDPIRWFLITSGGLGQAPVAPGTVGTLGGVALAVTLQWLCPGRTVLAWSIAAIVLFVWGSLQSDYVARTWPKKDPGAFVLDEVVGYLVTLIVYALLANKMPTALGHAGAFLWFRVFDVWKLQPCKWLEGLRGAWGIMADDQMAGVYAGVLLWVTLPWLG
ncbi:MAG TPA: phosphatidylglycerophosphatase A [Planctomycetes bacterium]|nr:phosphatidylglycerophosphatase A [Planctomycetota bacterium]